MKKILIALTFLFVATGCTDKEELRTKVRYEKYCTTKTSEVRADFILNCIKNGNPKSDEEPEDWIWLCGKMAKETYCPTIPMEITEVCGGNTSCFWYEVDRKPVNAVNSTNT